MKLVLPQRRDAYNSWHRYQVTGRYFLADFETSAGKIRRLPRGFRVDCFARCVDGGAGLERVLSVVASWATDLLVATDKSQIGAYYTGLARGPEGEELVSGIHAAGLKLHPELPVISFVLYEFEKAGRHLQAAFSRRAD